MHGLDSDAGGVHGDKPGGHGLVGLEIGLGEVARHAEHVLCSVGVGAEGLVAVDDDLAVLAVDGGGFARFAEFRLVLIQKLLLFRSERFDFADQPFHVVFALTDDLSDWRDQKIVEHNQSDKKVRQLDP